jgi:peptide/nickel transport system substrate-binding protein
MIGRRPVLEGGSLATAWRRQQEAWMTSKFRLGVAVMTTAVVVALSGCTSSGGSQAGGSAEQGGVLRVGISAAIDSLNPFVSQSDYSSIAYQYVYPHLIEYDAKLNFVPSFATKWDTSADGKTWTWHTVPGAKWSDGKPLTAKDAAFTLNMMMKYQNGPTALLASLVAHMTKAVATDDNTLVVTYSAPVANVLAQMQSVNIYPEQVWGPLATGAGKAITTFQNSAPMVSGGPFMMTSYTVNQIALFTRNPNWWGAKKPNIDGFGFQMFANEDAMVTALKTNQVDMIGESTPPTAVDTLKAAGMDVLTAPSLTTMTFIINTNPKKRQHLELLNPNVRKALEYAIDRQTIVNTAWLGHAQLGSTLLTPASGWQDTSIQAMPYDPAQANALLDAAGYPKGSDGIRVANGAPMSYNVVFPTEINGPGDRTFQIIQSDFKAIGIVIKQQKMDSDAAFTAIQGSDGKYEDYDLAMWDWVLPPDPDTQLNAMTCSQWGNLSDSGYCNPAYDAMYLKQGILINADQRHAMVNQMQQVIFDDRPYIILDYPNVIEAHSPKWAGFVMSPLVGSINNLSTQTLLDVHRVG